MPRIEIVFDAVLAATAAVYRGGGGGGKPLSHEHAYRRWQSEATNVGKPYDDNRTKKDLMSIGSK